MNTTAPSTPLDPAIALMQQRWKDSGIPDLYEGGNGPVSRERARNVRCVFYPKPALPTGSMSWRSIAGPGGPMAVQIVRPVQGESLGTLVYFHGGGWVLGDLDSHEAHAIRLANRSQVTVLHEDYRLGPEHPFPAAPLDACAALDWAWAHADELGGAGKPVAVGGDSAGGNLAAVAALHARDRGMGLAAQLLIYPATDLRGMRHSLVGQMYFGAAAETSALDPRASPLLAPSLQGLAPAIIGVGHHDFLYADNLAYRKALEEAGVPLVWRDFPELNHGFFSFVSISEASARAADLLCDDLRALMKA